MKHRRAMARHVRVVRRYNQHLTFWRVACVSFLALAVGLIVVLPPGPLLGVSELLVILALYVSAAHAEGKL